jgi:hypothetical protein
MPPLNPLEVSVIVVPGHNVEEPMMVPGSGNGVTDTVTDAVLLQPLAFVPFTV